MEAEIITIGDELLLGQTIDTNSAWLAEQLFPMGIRIQRITTIRDTRDAILNEVHAAFKRSALILITGGLGPTRDDITKETLAEYFGTHLERNREVLEEIERFFRQKGRPVLEVNRAQADLPADATLLRNTRGTAQGMWFEKDGKVLISMPGVPYEMKGIMNDGGFERLRERFNSPKFVQRLVLTQGLGESYIADLMSDWEQSLRNEGLALAYLPSPGLVRLRISGSASNGDLRLIEERINHYVKELERRLPHHVYGYDRASIAGVLGNILQERSASLSLAESCSGGYISHLITAVPGASSYYRGGVVCYSNEAKVELLAVDSELLKKHGAVSEEVVRAMAMGARERFGSTYALATSGIAGPNGGSDEKPVGTVWVAMASAKRCATAKLNLGKSRSRNITISSLSALNMLRNEILSKEL